jgi:hypothetical protein
LQGPPSPLQRGERDRHPRCRHSLPALADEPGNLDRRLQGDLDRVRPLRADRQAPRDHGEDGEILSFRRPDVEGEPPDADDGDRELPALIGRRLAVAGPQPRRVEVRRGVRVGANIPPLGQLGIIGHKPAPERRNPAERNLPRLRGGDAEIALLEAEPVGRHRGEPHGLGRECGDDGQPLGVRLGRGRLDQFVGEDPGRIVDLRDFDGRPRDGPPVRTLDAELGPGRRAQHYPELLLRPGHLPFESRHRGAPARREGPEDRHPVAVLRREAGRALDPELSPLVRPPPRDDRHLTLPRQPRQQDLRAGHRHTAIPDHHPGQRHGRPLGQGGAGQKGEERHRSLSFRVSGRPRPGPISDRPGRPHRTWMHAPTETFDRNISSDQESSRPPRRGPAGPHLPLPFQREDRAGRAGVLGRRRAFQATEGRDRHPLELGARRIHCADGKNTAARKDTAAPIAMRWPSPPCSRRIATSPRRADGAAPDRRVGGARMAALAADFLTSYVGRRVAAGEYPDHPDAGDSPTSQPSRSSAIAAGEG